jgi:high-affinity K+ transport system ATPase subunit B
MATEPAPLTDRQLAIAEALYRRLEELRKMGVRMVLLSLDERIGIRTIGKRADLAVSDISAPVSDNR